MRKSILLLFAVLCSLGASAKDIYVATNGNNSNAGTLEAPYATIQKAFDVVQAGDNIIIRGGTYSTVSHQYGNQFLKGKSGTADAPITIKAYEGETPILDKNKGHMEDKAQIVTFEDAAIIKKKNGEYAVRASYQGMELGMKPIDRETGVRYFLMPEGKEKVKLLTETLSSKYAHDVSNIMNRANRNLKIG